MHTKSLQTTLPEVIIQADCDGAIAQAMLRFAADDVLVRRSFDLDSACASLADNTCPHTGLAPCACHLAVLILHDRKGRIAMLIAHGDGRQTELYLLDSSDICPDPAFDGAIRTALTTLVAGTNDRAGVARPGFASTALWPQGLLGGPSNGR